MLPVAVWQKSKNRENIFLNFSFHGIFCNIAQQLTKKSQTK